MNEFEIMDVLKEKRENINTFDDLISFIRDVKDNYNCGYEEAPRAIAQATLAVAWYLASDFGITGFQASFVMWDFVKDWLYHGNECGLKIVDYDDMLYPQLSHKFEKTISKDTFEALQKAAKKQLEDTSFLHPRVAAHLKSIVDGNVPFGYRVEE